MATTFTVFSLGQQADIDTTEGNYDAENASALVGTSYGSAGDELFQAAQTFSEGSTGASGGRADAYDQNTTNDTFQIDGGPDQTFDACAVYNATVTYTDGTTADVSAVVFQDSEGNTYWAPEYSENADHSAMEAKPIQSLSLDSLITARSAGLNSDRMDGDFLTCYVRGTCISTNAGDRPVETLRIGDLVQTRDNGCQPIRWIGHRQVMARGRFAPIVIRKGALGPDMPRRDLHVSRQHRMLLRSKVVQRMFGLSEVLVPAAKLTGLPGIDSVSGLFPVSYFHLVTDQHDIILAEGAYSETMLVGPAAQKGLDPEALREISELFPDMLHHPPQPARCIPSDKRTKKLIERHARNRVAAYPHHV